MVVVNNYMVGFVVGEGVVKIGEFGLIVVGVLKEVVVVIDDFVGLVIGDMFEVGIDLYDWVVGCLCIDDEYVVVICFKC